VARPKSEDKRNAVLDAATRLFAERGLTAAPTSEISKQAGVAEGTLFTYFKTKDDLINALYREIKLELADAMMSDFPGRRMFVQGCDTFGIAMSVGALRIPSSARCWRNYRCRRYSPQSLGTPVAHRSSSSKS
jgi:AcrR family transcriptional regulator